MAIKRTLRKIYNKLPFKKQAYSFLKIFWVPPHSIYQHLYFKGEMKVTINPEAAFKIVHYGFEIENELFWHGIHKGWEKVSLELWIKLVNRSKVIFDIGANTGVYTMVAKAINPQAKVFAIEPVTRVYQKLVHNCSINNFSVETIEKAASDFDGTASIYEPMDEHVLSVTVNKNLNAVGRTVVEKTIKTVRLETVIKEYGLTGIDLMKIDVETHEAEVLTGFGEYLKMFRPTMLIEILNTEVANKIEDLVKGLDYLFFNINENGGVRQMSSLSKSDYYNFLLCDLDTAIFLNLIKQ